MDVSFVLAAARRFVWLIVLGVAIGTVVAMTVGLWTSGLHRSRAVLAVRPPTGANIFYADAEQYVEAEVVRLRSASVVRAARRALVDAGGPVLTAAEIDRIVTIEPEPLTGNVAIVATDDDPETAVAVATAYLDAYLASMPTEVVDEARRAELLSEATALTDELAAIDDEIATAMAPFLETVADEAAVPAPEAVVPAAMSRRQRVQAELEQIDIALLALDDASRLRINTTVVDDGSAPSTPIPLAPNPAAAGAIAVGAFGGLLAALLAGRLSPLVLDRRMGEVVLGGPVVASIHHDAALARGPVGALGELASATHTAIDRVCIHAETAVDGGLVIAVTSSQRPAGTTTLATAMACRFATWGRDVSLLDADGSDEDLASVLGADAAGTTPSAPGLRIRTLADFERPPAAQVDEASTLIDTARLAGRTSIVDCGPALRSATSRRVIELADVIVVAMPRHDQNRDDLAAVAEIVQRGGQPVLGVTTTIPR